MMKRAFDMLAATMGLIVSSPILLVVAVLVKISSRGPVFHRAVRVGRDGASFTVLKFRTMRVGGQGLGITVAGDPRVTTVGRWLRRFKIDELPQLLNVLRGEMSLVGPRPEDPRYVAGYTNEQRRVLSVRPGITSPASLTFRDEEGIIARRGGDHDTVYREEILPAKLAIDLQYVDCRSMWMDVRILLRTARVVARPRRDPGAVTPGPGCRRG